MDGVEAGVRRRRELDKVGSDGLGEPVRRGTAPVAVDEGGRAGRPISIDEPPYVPDRQAEDSSRRLVVQLAGHEVGQHQQALLCPGIQFDRLPRLHETEGDKVAVPLTRTKSLSLHTPA